MTSGSIFGIIALMAEETTVEQKSNSYNKKPLWQWILIYVIIAAIVYGVIYYFAFANKGGYNPTPSSVQPTTQQQNGQPTTQQETIPSVTQESASEMNVTLEAVNNSSESGTAILKETDGQVVVTLNLTGFQNNPQPAHIHAGQCPGVGAVKYPLTNVVNGQSVTTLNVTLAELEQQLPLAINVHESVANIKNYTSCGALSGQY